MSIIWNGLLPLGRCSIASNDDIFNSRWRSRPVLIVAEHASSSSSTSCTASTHRDLKKFMVNGSIALALSAFLFTAPSCADFLSYDHADMRGADLSGKDLKGSVFAACDCRLINLEGSNLDSSTVTFAGFQGANLQNTSWVRSLADRVVFREANLRNANFTNAILSGSQFDDITGADFTDSIIDKSQQVKMCKKAQGTNPVTGVETRESLLC
ncbi:hypothetical protein KP509_23G087100 [Ceratopteris richardii]|uniref:Uncharacterized protein n=1 Tax=Ceratopteris richardii TaxID=49495 RepID=A0A8T2S227_CERRI|nr:hypothetical protein KP509_23G087100 [Ceratopteris richardii]